MVAVSVNPLFIRQYYKKFRSTVITVIWPEMLVITLVGCSAFNVSDTVTSREGLTTVCVPSGDAGLRVDEHLSRDLKSDVDGARYCARFGDIVQNIHCIRKVGVIAYML